MKKLSYLMVLAVLLWNAPLSAQPGRIVCDENCKIEYNTPATPGDGFETVKIELPKAWDQLMAGPDIDHCTNLNFRHDVKRGPYFSYGPLGYQGK